MKKLLFLLTLGFCMIFLSGIVSAVNVTDAHGVSQGTSDTEAQNAQNGFKIVANFNVTLRSIGVVAGGTQPNRAYLMNSGFSELANASIANSVANFSFNLTAGTTYYVVATNTASTWTRFRGSTTYPIAGTNINWTGGRSGSGDEAAMAPTVVNVTTEVIVIANTSGNITVNLTSPPNASIQNNASMAFITKLTPGNANLSNGTLNVWFSNGSLFYNTTNSTLGNSSSALNLTFLNITGWSPATYLWNVRGCAANSTTNNICAFATDNYTFDWVPFSVNNQVNNTTVMETSRQTFRINFTTDSAYTVQNGRLVYNGTTYANADKLDLGSGLFQLTQTINIPPGPIGVGTTNKSFYWNITFSKISTGTTFNSSTTPANQTVTELVFQLCNTTTNVTMLNFTMYDEELNNTINASAKPTTFQATFNLGVYYDYKAKNISINNQSVSVNSFAFCTNNNTNIFYTNMEAFYTAVSYTDKNYYLTNASLTNVSNNISLYLLNATNAIEFFINVQQNLNPLTSASVNIEKYFVGEGVYKTVEIDKTSSDTGEFTAFLSLDKKYRFTMTKDGVVQGTVEKTASCSVAPCELTLDLTSTVGSYSVFSTAFGQNVLYNLSFNQSTKIVKFDFIDITGTATSFTMKIFKGSYNDSSQLISNQQLFTSSGSMTFNASNYTSGDFRAEVYVARSPNTFIDFITFVLGEASQTLGLLGLFMALIIILTIIFGLSFSPSLLVFSVPLSLTLAKLMGIISLSSTSIVLIYVLAVVIVASMSR